MIDDQVKTGNEKFSPQSFLQLIAVSLTVTAQSTATTFVDFRSHNYTDKLRICVCAVEVAPLKAAAEAG